MRKFFLVALSAALLLIACDDYGKKVSINDKSDVYYKGDNVTEAEAKKLGTYLAKRGWLDSTEAASVQLTKDTSAYVVRMVVDEEKLKKDKEGVIATLWHMQDGIAEKAFGGHKTKIVLTDGQFEDLEKLDMVSKVTVQKGRVYYRGKGVTGEDALNIGQFFSNVGVFNGTEEKEVFLTKGDAYVIRLPFDQKILNESKEEIVQTLKIYQYAIGKNIFKNHKTKIILTDSSLQDMLTIDDLTEEEKAAVDKSVGE